MGASFGGGGPQGHEFRSPAFTSLASVGLLGRGRQAVRHRPPAEGRDRRAHRGGPAAAAWCRRSLLLLEQRETRKTSEAPHKREQFCLRFEQHIC